MGLMGHPPMERLTDDLARQVCMRTNSHATLEGSSRPDRHQYSLILKAIIAPAGATLTSVEATAQEQESHSLRAQRFGDEHSRKTWRVTAALSPEI